MDFEKFAKEELIYIRNYIKDLPFSLVIAFTDSFENLTEDKIKEKQKKLYDMYRLSLDRDILNLHLAVKRKVKMLVKADGISIHQNGEVWLRTRGDTVLIGFIEQFGRTPEEIENNIREWLLVTVTKGNPKRGFDNAYIEEVTPLQSYVDFNEARRIIDEYSLTFADALLLGLGIKPCYDTYRLYLPRFFSLFYYDGKPLHVIQLTNVNAGKSYFAIRMEFVNNWVHFTEFPSPPKLIYDGRTSMKGAVFIANGVVIDEFDKLKKERFIEAYQSLNTGLENGVWRRGVQTFRGISLEGYRLIPFLIFGNVVHGEQPLSATFNENSRNYIINKLTDLTGMNTESFVERFALVDIVTRKIPIQKYLIKNDKGVIGVLKDSIIRGILTLAERSIDYKFVDFSNKLEGRLARHGEAIYNVFRMLTDKEINDIDKLAMVVQGDCDFGNLLEESQ